MNKHELKSLLENIYYTLTEAAPPPPPPQQSPAQWKPESPGLYIPGYGGFVPFHLPTPPPPPPPPPIVIKPQPGDDPALVNEINRLRQILWQLQRLDPIHHGMILQTLGIGSIANLDALIRQLIQQLERARQPLTA